MICLFLSYQRINSFIRESTSCQSGALHEPTLIGYSFILPAISGFVSWKTSLCHRRTRSKDNLFFMKHSKKPLNGWLFLVYPPEAYLELPPLDDALCFFIRNCWPFYRIAVVGELNREIDEDIFLYRLRKGFPFVAEILLDSLELRYGPFLKAFSEKRLLIASISGGTCFPKYFSLCTTFLDFLNECAR